MSARRLVQGAALALAAVVLAGCASDKPKPTPLESYTAQLAVRPAWTAKLDAVRFPLAVTVRGEQFVVAGNDGTVLALDAASGREAWRGQAGAALSAGVGSDGRRAAVVTVNNELVVLDQGAKLWSTRLASRTTTAPLVAGERVFVIGVDRVVHAFDALDGRRLWTVQRPGEALTLAQPGLLAAWRNTLVAGLGAVLTGIDPTTGSVRWEVPLTAPRGTNEVERLNDLVGPALRLGDQFCARAFQTAVGCVAINGADNASLRWSRIVGGQQAIGGDADFLFGADGSDRLSAWKTAGGELAWSNERLLYRGLSAPLSAGKAVVFGDAEGQLHFLDRSDGKTLQRLPTDGSPIVAQPVLAAGTVLAVTRNGGLFAFRIE
ncbi:MAG TPA: outer membrane protein assembly factor BamB [Aquabacterium sp.]|nr:outer membrane protein assembly factor BamB [Aquabacterium sp.]HQC96765.1 outer membrane protein assembly factor BamB [Aquabacterium sp.]